MTRERNTTCRQRVFGVQLNVTKYCRYSYEGWINFDNIRVNYKEIKNQY